MNIFRKAVGPTARETFLVTALAAIGVEAEAINAALAESNVNFLAEVLESSEKITSQLATAQATITTMNDALQGAGLPLAAAERDFAAALKSALAAREQSARDAAAREAADQLAARGLPPVPTAAAATTDGEPPKPGAGLTGLDKTRAIFEASLAQARRN